jgi:hypothetical protein
MGMVYRIRSLPRDVSRCKGTNCGKRYSCARYQQLERDKDSMEENHWGWTPVMDVLVNTDECTVRIEEER